MSPFDRRQKTRPPSPSSPRSFAAPLELASDSQKSPNPSRKPRDLIIDSYLSSLVVFAAIAGEFVGGDSAWRSRAGRAGRRRSTSRRRPETRADRHLI